MSYARVDMSQGQVYQNVCRMIASSPKHNGYSLFAAEYLLNSILTMPECEEPEKTRVNWLDMLKKEFPADYWNVTSKVRKSDNPKALRDSARSKCYYLRKQKKRSISPSRDNVSKSVTSPSAWPLSLPWFHGDIGSTSHGRSKYTMP